MDLENSRIMASLTVGEFKEVIGAVLDEKVTPKEAPHEYGHGIKCIMDDLQFRKGFGFCQILF